MNTTHAIYENGVFRPTEPVDLSEHTRVELHFRAVGTPGVADDGLDALYEIMSRRYESGERDVAARHNEHQP